MEFLNASNNAETQLLYDIDENDTSLQVRDVDIFPKPPFLVSINYEIIKVNSVDGNTFSGLERGQEGTTPAKHKAGDFVENRFTAGMYHNIMDNTVDNTNKIGILSGASGIKEKSNKEDLDALNQDLDAHKADIIQQLSKKVDKVAGKGLSTNDYTDEEKQKNQDNANNISDLQQDLDAHKADIIQQLSKKVDKVVGKGLSTNDYTDEEKQKNQDNANNISDLQQDLDAHKAENATTSAKGHVQLSDSTSSTSSSLAATAYAVKKAYDKGNHSHPYAPINHTHSEFRDNATASGVYAEVCSVGTIRINTGISNFKNAIISYNLETADKVQSIVCDFTAGRYIDLKSADGGSLPSRKSQYNGKGVQFVRKSGSYLEFYNDYDDDYIKIGWVVF